MKTKYTLLMVLIFLGGISSVFAQGTENFETLPDNQDFFSRDGKTFTSNNTNFDVITFAGAGAGGSDKFLDNFGFTSTNVTYSISTGGPNFTMTSVEYYVSNLVNGSVPSTSGSITFKGYEGGIEVFSYTKSDNFPAPTTSAPTYGFIELDFGTTPPTDLSSINIDRLDITLGGAFQYLSIDNFSFGAEVLQNDPPFVNGITIIGTPISTATTVGYNVIFNEPAFNVDASDFVLDTNGTAGNISSISGSNATYTVTVSNISGEGTISIDLIAGNNIADSGGNSPSPAFTNGENHLVSRCFQETFEGIAAGTISFTSNGIGFSTGTSNFDVELFDGGGAISDGGTGGSDLFLSNNANQVVDQTYSIFTLGPGEFTVEAIDVYVSSQANGANPTNDGSLTIRGLLGGIEQYTFTKNTGFPTTFTVNNGFTKLDFATEGTSDFSLTNIDQLEISTGGSFTYVGLDNFEHCEPVISTNPPIVQSISLVGNPEASVNTVDFQVTFNENAFNVSMDDFTLTTNNVSASISNLTGTGNVYMVTVSTITGEGTLRLDLLSGTDIADSDGNTPADPFTTGEVHFVSDCFIETFEALSQGDISWNTGGIPLTTGTANFSVAEFIDGGGGGSDRMLDNNTNQVINSTYTISITDTQTTNVGSLQVLLSSIIDATVPTDDGTITINGKLNGTTVYTISKTSGFPTSYGVDQGFYLVDFVTEGGVDNSTTDVDQLEITLGGNFRFIALDNLKLCGDSVPPNAICQDVTVLLDGSGMASLTATQVNNGSNDAESSITLSIDISTFDCSNIGENTVTLTVTDESGNMATCTATITVEDNIAPVITCPASITQVNDGGACGAVISYALPSVTDNCLGTEPPLFINGFTTLGDFDGSRFYVSDSQFTGSAGFNDAITRGGFLATINDAAENQFLATALTNASIATANIGFNDVAIEGSFVWQSGSSSIYTNWNPGEPNDVGGEDYTQLINNGTWNDIPDASAIQYILELPIDGFAQIAGLPSGSEFPVGTTTNTFQYRDAGGNIDTCSFDVTITDNEAPVVSCQDVTVALDENGEYTLVLENYSVSQDGTFAPIDISVGGSVVSLSDDSVSGALAIGFDFEFYGTTYTDFYISSNGFMTFNTDGIDGCCNGQLIPSPTLPNNLIAFAWEDLNPNSGGTIRYETIGTAPNRVLVMGVDALAHFGGGDLVTAQVHLFEGSNKIEIHTATMPGNPTNTWEAHTQGIENNDGTQATFVDGRNANNTWTATNDYVSFTPPTYNVQISDNCDIASVVLSQTEFTCLDAGSNPVTVTVTDVNGNMETCTFNVIVPGNTATYTAGGWVPSAPDMNTAAVFEADYNTAIDGGSIDACGCRVSNNATLTVAPLMYLNVIQNIEVDAGSKLVVEHQGSVVQVSENGLAINNGEMEVIVDQPLDVDSRDFSILGSPMTIETSESVWSQSYNRQFFTPENFIPNSDVASSGVAYNFSDDNLDDWNPYLTGTLNPGEGYLVLQQESYGGDLIDGFKYEQGTLNTGTIISTLNYNGTQIGSPNILSNPYPSGISATSFLAQNPFVDTVYFWEHNTAPSTSIPGPDAVNYSMQDVSAFNSMGGVPAASGGDAPTDVIATSQGFGVFASQAGPISFNNSMRVTDGNTTLRTSDLEETKIWLSIDAIEYETASTTLIGFTTKATESFDYGYDNKRLGTYISLYSHYPDGTDALSIQGRERFTSTATVPLGFDTVIEEQTQFEISIRELEGSTWDDHFVYLTDHITGETINLSKINYSFVANEGTFDNRFTLHFVDRNVLDSNQVTIDTISVFPNPTTGQFTMVKPYNLKLETLEIFDISGRLILKEDLSLTTESKVIDISSMPVGTYLCVFNGNGEELVKRIIKK